MREIDIFECSDPSVKWSVDSFLATIETDKEGPELEALMVQFAADHDIDVLDLVWWEA
jgi:hypothetical protein